jgi:hypothetical protein
MSRADRRFVVSHVGSMVRPPAMTPYLQKQRAGEPWRGIAHVPTKSVLDLIAQKPRQLQLVT